jgi:hypothetical protein
MCIGNGRYKVVHYGRKTFLYPKRVVEVVEKVIKVATSVNTLVTSKECLLEGIHVKF